MSDLPTGLVLSAGGIVLHERVSKVLCKWCGAAYERRANEADVAVMDGVKAHELQCRHRVRQVYIQAALSGPLTARGGEAIVDTVDAVMAAVERGDRATFKDGPG